MIAINSFDFNDTPILPSEYLACPRGRPPRRNLDLRSQTIKETNPVQIARDPSFPVFKVQDDPLHAIVKLIAHREQSDSRIRHQLASIWDAKANSRTVTFVGGLPKAQ